MPDGTTALVRCPACKTVFSPTDGATPAEPLPGDREERPRRQRPEIDDEDDYDDRPRRRRRPRDEEDEDDRDAEPENRDFDPIDPGEKPRRRRRYVDDDSMSPEGSYRQELADKLRNKLMSAGEEFYNKKMYRESFESLCDAYRVSPVNNKPGTKIVKMLHDAERRAKVSVPCSLK